MELKKITENLIKFKTATGNAAEIDKCLEYVTALFGDEAQKFIYRKSNLAPVLLLSNAKGFDFDVLTVGHLDVVPAQDLMFEPRFVENKLFARGALDMKSFAAVGLNSLEYVIKNKLPVKFGVLLSTDEEKGSFGLDSFLKDYPEIKAKIVLDVDVAGDIQKIVAKCKNPVFVKIIAEGLEAHGSTPWEGIDANEKMLNTLANIRKLYPYFSKELQRPQNTWIDTVHFAKIEGGEVANVISNHCEALLDFRLTENSTLEGLEKNLQSCMIEGVRYEIVSSSVPVVMPEDNPFILQYKNLAEKIINHDIEFDYIGGATDSRAFALKGSIVIMHSGTGEGMHASNEYVVWESVEQLAEIQKQFLQKIAENGLTK
ncbi:MAG: M20 family metallopeptidase [Alphaproteobacteria bacterium]|nr:M20 family metallopeptidase [Alphaproteobacteria bacterium]